MLQPSKFFSRPYDISVVWSALLVIVGLLFFSIPSSAQTYYANGNAKYTGGDCFRLTEAINFQNGSVWYADKINLAKDFDLEFYMNFGSNDIGADGIVFVLQDTGNQALGISGGGMGFEGFSPSLGVEFDDYQNTINGDPIDDHIAILRDGNSNHNSNKALYPPTTAIPGGGNIEDGTNHLVRIIWHSKKQLFEVYFDCIQRISLNYDIQEKIFDGKQFVFWGFTAATGGLNNEQTVCLRKDIIARDTVSVCKGEEVRLNSRVSLDDTYRWRPANDLDNTTIKRPTCTTQETRTYYVQFKDLCGDLIQDTVAVLVDEPFTMDEVKDSLLCDQRRYKVDLRLKYDSVRWNDNHSHGIRWLADAGYYKFRAWKGACWDDDSLTITTSKTPKLKIIGDSVFCSEDNTILSLDLTPSDADFEWHDGSTDTNFTATFSQTVMVFAQNECGFHRDLFKVREITLPVIEIVGKRLYCPGDSVTLEVVNHEPYLPMWDDGTIGPFRIVADGLHEARITEKNCESSDTFSISKLPNPRAELPIIPLLCDFQELYLTSDQPQTERKWSNGETSTTVDYTLETGQHWLKVFNGCGIDSLGFEIERHYCTCDILVPNAFTPNGDGKNERFNVIADCDVLLNFELQVFNRWGQMVFSSNDIEQGWDGYYRERLSTSGIYMWVARYKGVEGRTTISKTQTGKLTLLH